MQDSRENFVEWKWEVVGNEAHEGCNSINESLQQRSSKKIEGKNDKSKESMVQEKGQGAKSRPTTTEKATR